MPLILAHVEQKPLTYRSHASDANPCTFEGTIQSDGVTVRGTYTCTKFKPTGSETVVTNADQQREI